MKVIAFNGSPREKWNLGTLLGKALEGAASLGSTEEMSKERGFDQHIRMNEVFIERVFGETASLCCYDTYQFQDYAKVFAPRCDAEKKAKRHREIFPLDCDKAREMGMRLVST